LYRLGVSDKTIQAILRHSNVNVTTTYYIKTNSSDVTAAMEKFEQNIAEQSEGQAFRDSDRTVNSTLGTQPGFVN
jgi:hypothetical protein